MKLIRIDGGTQSRVSLNQETVAEYAEAYKAGAQFPAVTVFFDGTDRWLADGFHRFFAAKAAGKKTILESIIPGTLRDAVLFSLTANGTHGLKASNADKRKAVETLLNDCEWAGWSDRKIAEHCGVSHPFVAAIRNPVVAEKQKANRDTSIAKKVAKVESDSTPVAAASAPKPAPKVKQEPEDAEYFGPSQEEIDAALEDANQDIETLHKLLESDDKLAALKAENDQLRAELAVVKISRDGYMNRSNELITRIKTLKRKLEKAEANV
ncbi:hypothetical protein [Variovorax sp. RT4R15]|uniref:hypothetical protein n=1 Tax=Variovorax sp. RT4R15 TaxID=3443737 RepID=UPI003F4951D9